MDLTVKPGDDFYQYANGTWYCHTLIPPDRSSVGSFYTAGLATERQTTEILDSILSTVPYRGSDEAKVNDFYIAFTNTNVLDLADLTSINPDLDRFDSISTRDELSKVLGETLRADVDPMNLPHFWTHNLFGLFVSQGLTTPDVLPYLIQGGLGLPGCQYYLSTQPQHAEIREAYREYIREIFILARFPTPDESARRVYDLEMKIAAAHESREISEDYKRKTTIWTLEDLYLRAPGIKWSEFSIGAQLDTVDRFIAYSETAIPRLSALVRSEPLQSWKEWLSFSHLDQYTDVLPARFDRASFDFFHRKLYGVTEQRPRDERALDLITTTFPDLIGKLYIERYFPDSTRRRVEEMVSRIKETFLERLRTLTQLSPETKHEAIRKVENLHILIGGPDQWRDYSNYYVSRDDAYANLFNGRILRYMGHIAKIGHPSNRREWWLHAHTLNAANLPVQNALIFPAAILQPPFFDSHADDSYNYGAIGVIIGHEISHAFDDNGSAFDSTGRIRNWWTLDELESFRDRGAKLARQYSQYEVLPGLFLDGQLSLSENIADLVGLQTSYDAFSRLGIDREGSRQFFLAFAHSWRYKTRDESLRAAVATDCHAPAPFRIRTVRNINAWYTAFNVQPGDQLYLGPEERVRIW